MTTQNRRATRETARDFASVCRASGGIVSRRESWRVGLGARLRGFFS
jgi:hypothetical protein